ncbi:phosphopantetheine-binding protein [Streptomyces sp. RLA2-12]|uniref:phosphopantetheine-binding protein n=1 Tax=Streptomyces sp. RLA2-12 TaxID=2721242 RepID=UPI002006ED2F|nr:phosphopantetheine-binding protein [Streptomyces sp. RLA2-12]
MTAVLGLAAARIEEICADCAPLGVVEIANYNEPGQTVISGQRPAVEEAARRALAAGAERAVALKVSAPFHCSLMRAIEDEFAAELERVPFSAPRLPVISSVTGTLVRDGGHARDLLRRQLAGPVRWVDVLGAAAAHAVDGCLEVGPGRCSAASPTAPASTPWCAAPTTRAGSLHCCASSGRSPPLAPPPDPARGPPPARPHRPRRPLPPPLSLSLLPLPPPLLFPSLPLLFPLPSVRCGPPGRYRRNDPSERQPTVSETLTPTSTDYFSAVQAAIADALGIDEAEAVPEATLLGQLGAESIDLLDILFRIERATKVKITVADIAALLQGGIPDEEFGDENEVVNDTGLTHLEKVLPQFDRSQLSEPLTAEGVLGLFTVQNLTDLLTERAAAQHAA